MSRVYIYTLTFTRLLDDYEILYFLIHTLRRLVRFVPVTTNLILRHHALLEDSYLWSSLLPE